jgi:hypothetical protein
MQITEFELWRERHAGLLREAENARLARLIRAERPKLANGAPSEELGPQRRGIAARGVAVVMALFR